MVEDKGKLLVELEKTQRETGHLSTEYLAGLAKSLDIPLSRVYGVASFYSFLATKPQGRNVIRICRSLPCILKNAEMIIETISEELGIKPGQTTADGRFTFELTNCVGACDKAPAMLVNDDVYGDLTPAKISKILDSYD